MIAEVAIETSVKNLNNGPRTALQLGKYFVRMTLAVKACKLLLNKKMSDRRWRETQAPIPIIWSERIRTL